VSFNLRDLLAGAPIKAAARNQREAVNFVSADKLKLSANLAQLNQTGSSSGTGSASGGAEGESSSSSWSGGKGEGEKSEEVVWIKASECLRRLARKEKQEKKGKGAPIDWLRLGLVDAPSAEEQQREAKEQQRETEDWGSFQLVDLIQGGASLGKADLRGELELLVEPQSVRVVKLVEL